MAGWYTLDEARDDWPGAPLNDAQLQLVLDVSESECAAFAPLPPAGYTPHHLDYGTAGTVDFTRTGDTVTCTVITDPVQGLPGTTIPEQFWPTTFQVVAQNLAARVMIQHALDTSGLVLVTRFAGPPVPLTAQYHAVPADPDTGGDIPDGHRWAHLQHARNIWNAQKVNPSGGLGDDTQGFALTPFPLDWAVRARLAPRVIFGGSVG